jgi:hypothetical protein
LKPQPKLSGDFMPLLPPEFGRQFAALLREHLRLQADIRSLASMLKHAEASEVPPYGWLDALKALRETPAYRSISEQYEPQFHAIEDAADGEECLKLLATMPPTRLPN